MKLSATPTLVSLLAFTLLYPITLSLAAPVAIPIASPNPDNGISPVYDSNGISPSEPSQLPSGSDSGVSSSGGDSGNGSLGVGGNSVAQPPPTSYDPSEALRELGDSIGRFGQGEGDEE